MSIVSFLFALLLLGFTKQDFEGLLRCGSSSLNNEIKYFMMMEEFCFTLLSSPTKTTQIATQQFFTCQSDSIILFRLISGSGVHPYEYFVSPGDVNSSVTDRDRNYSKNFRSLLLDQWSHVRPLQMNVTIRDTEDRVIAGLLFNVGTQDDMSTWFAKKNLQNSFNWNISFLQRYDYNKFSIKGDGINRVFYINLAYDDCTNDKGVLIVTKSEDSCSYANSLPNLGTYIHPRILFVNFNGQAGIWKANVVQAKSLEITGVYGPSITVCA